MRRKNRTRTWASIWSRLRATPARTASPATAESRAVSPFIGNYPNPFNPGTEIRYALASAAHVQLIVYDAAGRLIRNLADGNESAGSEKKKTWDGLMDNGLPAPAGVYVYRLTARSGSQTFQQSRKMTLNK